MIASAKGRTKLIDVKIGTRLKLLRLKYKMSRGVLGKAVGVSYQQIQKYEQGNNRISAARLHQFSRILNVQMDYFFAADQVMLNVSPDKNTVAALWEKIQDDRLKTGLYLFMRGIIRSKVGSKRL